MRLYSFPLFLFFSIKSLFFELILFVIRIRSICRSNTQQCARDGFVHACTFTPRRDPPSERCFYQQEKMQSSSSQSHKPCIRIKQSTRRINHIIMYLCPSLLFSRTAGRCERGQNTSAARL
jgi:hypothetical protein